MTKQQINWGEVRARIQAGRSALEESLSASPARTHAVFRKRAALLAQSRTQTAPQTIPIPALIFTLQSERYALSLHELAEVLPFRDCTPVPGSAPEFLGVINWHGELRPVMDLGRIIQPDRQTEASGGFILMLRKLARPVGLRVDSVEGLHEIRCESLDSGWRGKYTTRYTTGLSAAAGEELLLLNPQRLLSSGQ